MSNYEWHIFDEEQQLEVCNFEKTWRVRKIGTTHFVTLSDEEWEQVRESGPDPQIMKRLN